MVGEGDEEGADALGRVLQSSRGPVQLAPPSAASDPLAIAREAYAGVLRSFGWHATGECGAHDHRMTQIGGDRYCCLCGRPDEQIARDGAVCDRCGHCELGLTADEPLPPEVQAVARAVWVAATRTMRPIDTVHLDDSAFLPPAVADKLLPPQRSRP